VVFEYHVEFEERMSALGQVTPFGNRSVNGGNESAT
jgi:hypothetical protein